LVTGVQTCALPIWNNLHQPFRIDGPVREEKVAPRLAHEPGSVG